MIPTDPGQLVAYGPLLVAIPVAMAAGLVSFLSPCCLPLVPGYLAYVTGTAGADAESGNAPRAARGGGASVAVASVATEPVRRRRPGRTLPGRCSSSSASRPCSPATEPLSAPPARF